MGYWRMGNAVFTREDALKEEERLNATLSPEEREKGYHYRVWRVNNGTPAAKTVERLYLGGSPVNKF